MSGEALAGTLELGLIYALVGLGVFLTFRVARAADLTADGAFALGAVMTVVCLERGVGAVAATLAAAAAGGVAGGLTAWLAGRLAIDSMLPGILTTMALYSVNLRLLGRPNAALPEGDSLLGEGSPLLALAAIVVAATLAITYYLHTDHGLAMRAAGAHPRMAAAQGIRSAHLVWLAFVASNALVALAGALFAQAQGFADVGMGTGTVVFGLAAVLLGEAMLPGSAPALRLSACLLGALTYRLVVGMALGAGVWGLQASDINLVTAGMVALALGVARLRASASTGVGA